MRKGCEGVKRIRSRGEVTLLERLEEVKEERRSKEEQEELWKSCKSDGVKKKGQIRW